MPSLAVDVTTPSPEPFVTRAEYEDRLHAVRAAMQGRDLGALLVSRPEDTSYLTGFRSMGHFVFRAMIVTHEGEPRLALPLVRFLVPAGEFFLNLRCGGVPGRCSGVRHPGPTGRGRCWPRVRLTGDVHEYRPASRRPRAVRLDRSGSRRPPDSDLGGAVVGPDLVQLRAAGRRSAPERARGGGAAARSGVSRPGGRWRRRAW